MDALGPEVHAGLAEKSRNLDDSVEIRIRGNAEGKEAVHPDLPLAVLAVWVGESHQRKAGNDQEERGGKRESDQS